MGLVLHADKGSPLTHEEMDENFRVSGSMLGEWSATSDYIANNLAVHNGLIYRSKTSNLNKTPPANLSDWELYVAVSNDVEVVTDADHDYVLAKAGYYHRHTSTGAKTGVFNSAVGFTAGREYHVANRAASGDLTLSGTGVTLNPPKGGTLALEPGDTVTVKFISSTEADVYGSTAAL